MWPFFPAICTCPPWARNGYWYCPHVKMNIPASLPRPDGPPLPVQRRVGMADLVRQQAKSKAANPRPGWSALMPSCSEFPAIKPWRLPIRHDVPRILVPWIPHHHRKQHGTPRAMEILEPFGPKRAGMPPAFETDHVVGCCVLVNAQLFGLRGPRIEECIFDASVSLIPGIVEITKSTV